MARDVQTRPMTTEVGTTGLSRGWVRAGGVFGLATVVLIAGAFAFAGSDTLNSSSPATQISAYLAGHGNAVLMETVLTVAGSALGLWLLATLARLIHQRDAGSPLGLVLLMSATVATAIASLDGVTLSALVYLAKQGVSTDASVVRIFFDLENGLIMPGLFGLFVAGALAAAGVAMLRGRFAAPWAGWMTLVIAALSAGGGITALTSVSGGMTAIGYSPAIGYGIFAVVVSIFLLRDRESAA